MATRESHSAINIGLFVFLSFFVVTAVSVVGVGIWQELRSANDLMESQNVLLEKLDTRLEKVMK